MDKPHALLATNNASVLTRHAKILDALEGIEEAQIALLRVVGDHPLQPVGVIGTTLCVGSVEQARDGALLDDLGITHVLCCCRDDLPGGRAAPLVTPSGRVLVHATIHADDCYDFPLLHNDATDQALRFLHDVHESVHAPRVLVHCLGGVNRSAALAVAFAAVRSAPHTDAAALITQLRTLRPLVLSNPGFVHQLARLDVEAWRERLGMTTDGDTKGCF